MMSTVRKKRSTLKPMRTIGDAVHINLLLTRNMLRAIDEYRRRSPTLPNRTEAIRELLQVALTLKPGQQRPAAKKKTKGE